MNNRPINNRLKQTASNSGFSLIELLIVVALMIIMTLIGVNALVKSRGARGNGRPGH
ncbi:MAG: prepilin-type N-terminal cleavage/methylation domain-containing protein [Pyrinomonadaceae bacterium]